MKRILCLLLSILMVMPAMVSCGTKTEDTPDMPQPDGSDVPEAGAETEPKSDTESTEAETEPVTEAATEAETETEAVTETAAETEPGNPVSLTVIAGGATDYGLVVDDAVLKKNSSDVDWLKKILKKQYGVELKEAAEADGHAIEIRYLAKPDHKLDYQVMLDEETGKILIEGGCDVSLTRAVQQFAIRFCAVPGNLTVDAAQDVTYRYKEDKIDNSALLSYQGGVNAKAAPSDADGKLMTPTWFDTAVMVELRIDTASIGGTLAQSLDLLDFYAECGVNTIWLCPIYERSAGGNGYGNVGLHRVEPTLTGTKDPEKGWEEVKKFVDYAHSKGIYILLDLITWGVMSGTELYKEHPDWFKGKQWGNEGFNWNNEVFVDWFVDTAVENYKKTGADGYRCDCEPQYAGYDVFAEIRGRLNSEGYYPVIIAEDGNTREGAFDAEQDGVLNYTMMTRAQLYQKPVNFYLEGSVRLVDSVKKGTALGEHLLQMSKKGGTYRYYLHCLTNHDHESRNVNGNRLKMGYSAIFAPFIPLWYMGDEFDADSRAGVLYTANVDYGAKDKKPDKAQFLEDVKQMIAIRRAYPEIFEYWPLNHRESNICEVEASLSGVRLQQYARYRDNRMILVVANNRDTLGIATVEIPFAEAFTKDYASYRVTDLLTGAVLAEGAKEEVAAFHTVIPYEYNGVYLVEGLQ